MTKEDKESTSVGNKIALYSLIIAVVGIVISALFGLSSIILTIVGSFAMNSNAEKRETDTPVLSMQALPTLTETVFYETATSTITPMLTQTFTPEPTETSIPAATREKQEIIFENFDNGSFLWSAVNSGDQWNVYEENANSIYCVKTGEKHNFAYVDVSINELNYVIEFDMKVVDYSPDIGGGGIILFQRSENPISYYQYTTRKNEVLLTKLYNHPNVQVDRVGDNKNISVGVNEWHHYRIEVDNPIIEVYYDDILVVVINDDEFLGGTEFQIGAEPNSSVCFDDVFVYIFK